MGRLRTYLFVLLGSSGSLLLFHFVLRRWQGVERFHPLATKRGWVVPAQQSISRLSVAQTQGSQPTRRSAPVFVLRKPFDAEEIFNPVKILPILPSSQVVRVIVVTYFRAGSTFLGEILQQNWRTFYHFEPLHYLSGGGRVSGPSVSEALALLSNLFRCNFTETGKYVQWAASKRHQFLFRRNHFLWSMCRVHSTWCFSPRFVTSVCLRAPVQVMKVTRLDMEHVLTFLRDNQDLRVQVVHLVRDPRAVVRSRLGLDWCNETSCADPGVLCDQMAEDLEVSRQIEKEGVAPLLRVPYEDLALRPERETQDLYRRLGLPYTPAVVKFLRSHTRAQEADGRDPYSTRRNSSSVPFEWKQRLSYGEISRIQKVCLPVLHTLGYRTVLSP